MTTIMMIDGLGKRYGMLPSEIMKRADTFDLYIMDCAMTFENYHHKKAMNNGKDPLPEYTTEQLLNIMNKKNG